MPPSGPHTSCSAVPGLIRLILLSHPREPPPARPGRLQGQPRASRASLLWSRWEFYRPAARRAGSGGSEKPAAPSHTLPSPASLRTHLRSRRFWKRTPGTGGEPSPGPAGHTAPPSPRPHLPHTVPPTPSAPHTGRPQRASPPRTLAPSLHLVSAPTPPPLRSPPCPLDLKAAPPPPVTIASPCFVLFLELPASQLPCLFLICGPPLPDWMGRSVAGVRPRLALVSPRSPPGATHSRHSISADVVCGGQSSARHTGFAAMWALDSLLLRCCVSLPKPLTPVDFSPTFSQTAGSVMPSHCPPAPQHHPCYPGPRDRGGVRENKFRVTPKFNLSSATYFLRHLEQGALSLLLSFPVWEIPTSFPRSVGTIKHVEST